MQDLPEDSNVIFRWSFDQFDHHERSTWWYVFAALVVGAFLVYSVASSNMLFAVLVILITVIIFVRQAHGPRHVVCEISEEGISLNARKYSYRDIAYFSVVPTRDGEPMLYIHEARGFKGLLPVPLKGQPTEDIREFLHEFIIEDTDHLKEPVWDYLMRRLKL